MLITAATEATRPTPTGTGVIAALVAVLACVPGWAAPPPAERLAVRVETAEPEAVLAILDLRAAGREPVAADWERLFTSEGYRRLREREEAMRRPFSDEEFRTFVLSPELMARAPALRETLTRWRRADATAAAERALAYLPAGAVLRATIYPSIKPRTNSFVFDLEQDPAIFLYLDPEISAAKVENTLAHELHHVGFGSACPPADVQAAIDALPETEQLALRWLGAFGEGLAMLAAAGGPEVDPHAASNDEERQRWARDLARAGEDVGALDAFFRDVLAGRLSGDAVTKEAMAFFGDAQGPWYTVGYRMATTIERALGRDRLIAAFCDPRTLLSTHAEATAARGEAVAWSPELVSAIGTRLKAP